MGANRDFHVARMVPAEIAVVKAALGLVGSDGLAERAGMKLPAIHHAEDGEPLSRASREHVLTAARQVLAERSPPGEAPPPSARREAAAAESAPASTAPEVAPHPALAPTGRRLPPARMSLNGSRYAGPASQPFLPLGMFEDVEGGVLRVYYVFEVRGRPLPPEVLSSARKVLTHLKRPVKRG